jgi:hypothetical protein
MTDTPENDLFHLGFLSLANTAQIGDHSHIANVFQRYKVFRIAALLARIHGNGHSTLMV